MEKQHVAVYARQSIDKKDSISIDSQIEFCKREVLDGDIVVYDDRGFSGKNIKRPGFTRLISAIESGSVSKVVCYRLDRISRSITDFGRVWEICQKHNVEFVSVNEKFDTSTPVGRAMLYIIMVFAQLERETIAERVKDNYYQRVKIGAWPGGKAPYAYAIEKIKGQGATLVPLPTLKLVPSLFDMYNEHGASLGSLCRHLNTQGILTCSGGRWSTVAIGRVLRSPSYVMADARVYAYYFGKGVIPACDIDEMDGRHAATIVGKRQANERKYTDMSEHVLAIANHTGVVASDVFLAAQHKLDTNKQIKNDGKGKLSFLSGKVKCGECGYSLSMLKDAQTDRIYFRCSGRTNHKLCNYRHSENIKEVEDYVSQVLMLAAPMNTKPKLQNDSQTEAVNKIAKIDVKISNLINGIADATGASVKYISAEIDKQERQKLELMAQLGQWRVDDPLAGYLNDNKWEDFTLEMQKQLLASMVSKVILKNDAVEIVWKI